MTKDHTGHANSWGGRKLEGSEQEILFLQVLKKFQFSLRGDWLEWRPSSVARRDSWRLPGIRCGGSFYALRIHGTLLHRTLPVGPCHARHTPTSASHAQRAVTRPPRCSMWANMDAEWGWVVITAPFL